MSLVEEHLGGYTFGGDEATYFPELWDWLLDRHTDARHYIIDVGCGDGIFVKHVNVFNKPHAIGIDGVPQEGFDFVQHDFTKGPVDWAKIKEVWNLKKDEKIDTIWCCEFVEHVEEQFVPNFLELFEKSETVLMTHAFPNQAGHHHVNCQRPEYWIAKMETIGLHLDALLTYQTRQKAAANKSPWNHYTRSGMAFTKD